MKDILTITAAVLLSLFACTVDSLFDSIIPAALGIAGLASAFGAAKLPDLSPEGDGKPRQGDGGYDKHDDHNPYPEE